MKLLAVFILLTSVQTAPPVPRETVEVSTDKQNDTDKKATDTKKNSDAPVGRPKPPAEGAKNTAESESCEDKSSRISVNVFGASSQKSWWDRIYVISNVVLVLITLGVAFASFRAASAALLNAQAVINAARPWLLIPLGKEFSDIDDPFLVARDIKETRPSFCIFKMKNFGQSPARVVQLKMGLFVGTEKQVIPNVAAFSDENAIIEEYTFPQGTVAPLQTTFELDGRISAQEFNEIKVNLPRTRYLWLCGYMRYKDTLERKKSPIYETRFCYRWVNDTDRPTPFWIIAGPREYNRAI